MLQSLIDLLVWFTIFSFCILSTDCGICVVLDENAAHREVALEHSRVERLLVVLCSD